MFWNMSSCRRDLGRGDMFWNMSACRRDVGRERSVMFGSRSVGIRPSWGRLEPQWPGMFRNKSRDSRRARGSRDRDRPQSGGHVGSWGDARHQVLDFGLAPVLRGRKQSADVFGRQVGRQQTRPGQMKPPVRDRLEECGIDPGLVCHVDPAPCFVVRHAQHSDTIRPERRMPGRHVKLANLDLGKMREHFGRGGAIASHQVGQIADENVIGDVREGERTHGPAPRGLVVGARSL